MAQVIQQARIVGAALRAIERGIGRAGDRHRRFDAGRSVDAGQDHALKRWPASRRQSAELFNHLRETSQGEGLAGAGRSQDRRQKRRLDLRGHAKMSQRLHDLAGVQEVRPVGRVAEEDRVGPAGRARGRWGDRNGRRGRLCGGPRSERERRLVARPDVPKQADLRIHAWLGQSILLNARSENWPSGG